MENLEEFDFKNKSQNEIIEYIESLSNTEEDLLKKAYAYHVIQDKAKAREIYFDILKSNPNKIEAYLGIADICYYSGEYLKAIDCLYRANEVEENNIDILVNLATNYEYVDLKTAFKVYNKIIEIDNKFAGAYIDIGRIYYYYYNEDDLALEYYNKGIKLDATSHIFYNARGSFYLDKNRFEEALNDFDKCIELNDEYVRAYIKKSEILLRFSVYGYIDFKEILALLKKAESIENNDYHLYLFMAITFEKLNDYESAIEYYKKHIDIYGDQLVYVLLAKLYLKQNKKREASKILKDAGLKKHNFNFHKIIKKIFASRKPLIKETNRFNNAHKYRISRMDELADYLYILGYETDAIRLYEEKCREDKKNSEAHLICGSMYMKKGSLNKALYYFKKVVKINKDTMFSLNNIGVIYKEKKKYKKALKIFIDLMNKHQDYANPVYNIATIYYETKDYKNAKKYYEKCLKMKSADKEVKNIASNNLKVIKKLLKD